MDVQRQPTRDTDQESFIRTGPVGRSVRLVMALISAVLAVDWFADGMSWYADPSSPTDLRVLLLTGFAGYYVFYFLPRAAWGRQTASRSVVALTMVAAGAAAMSLGLNTELWSQPLTGLLYAIDGTFLMFLSLTSVAAVFLGTPGCEFNGLADLIHRARKTTRTQEPPLNACIFGLHLLDAWEATRRQRASADSRRPPS